MSEYASRDANASTYASTTASTSGAVHGAPKATAAERARDGITLAVREVDSLGSALDSLKQAVDANDPAAWHEHKTGLDRDLALARKHINAARTNATDAEPAARAELDRAEALLAERTTAAASFTSPPRGWSPVPNEEHVLAIFAAPISGSKQAGFAEKESQLKAALAQLSPADSQRLVARLAKPMKDDPIAAAFTRLTAERQKTIFSFLGDARKRTAQAQAGLGPSPQASTPLEEPLAGTHAMSEANAIVAVPAQDPLDAQVDRMIDAGEPDLDALMRYDGTQRRALARRLETYRPGNGDALGARFIRLDTAMRTMFLAALRADGPKADKNASFAIPASHADANAPIEVPKQLRLDPTLTPAPTATTTPASATDKDEQPASPSLNAVAKYLQINSTPAWAAIAEALPRMQWSTMSPRLEYQPAALDGAISLHLYRALGSFELAALKELLYPQDVVAALEPFLPSGNKLIFPSTVGVVLSQLVHIVLVGSVSRMASRYVDVSDAMFAAAPTSAPKVTRDQLATSHPMDRVAAWALTDRGVATVAPDADVITGKRKIKNPALRPVKLAWEGEKDPTLWNFVRATPADATAEEVAASLFDYAQDASGDATSYYAYGIAAAPPLFGLPMSWARLFPQARAHAPATIKAGKLPDEKQDTIGARLTTLATSNDSDELALMQTPHDAHGPAPSREEVLTTLDECTIQLEHLRSVLVPWELSVPVIGETIHIASKRSQLASAAPDQIAAWAPIAVGQRDRLRDISEMVANVTKAAGSLGVTTQGSGKSDPLRQILGRLAEAAATSHLAATSDRILAEARGLQAGLSLRALQSNVAALESSVMGAEAVAPSDKHAVDISGPYEQTKEDAERLENTMLSGGEVSADELERVQLDAQTIALRARIHSLQVQLDQIEGQWIAERAGMMSHLVATSKFKDIFGAALFINGRLGEVYSELKVEPPNASAKDPKAAAAAELAAKRDAVARAQASFRALSEDQDLGTFFKNAYSTMKSQQLRTAIAQAAALLVISVASAGAGGVIAEGIGEGFLAAEGVETVTELSLGARAAIQVGSMGTEVMGNAIGQTITMNTSFTSALVDNAMFVVGSAGTSKALGKLLEDIPAAAAFEKLLTKELAAIEAQEARAAVAMSKLAQASKAAAWTAKQGAAITGHTIMGMAIGFVVERVHQIGKSKQHGDANASSAQLGDWLLQGASVAVGRFIHASLGERMPSFQRLAQQKQLAQAQRLLDTAQRAQHLASTVISTPEPHLALELLNERVATCETELEVLNEAERAGIGGTRAELEQERTSVNAEVAGLRSGEMLDVRWRLAGLDSLGGGVWSGSREHIAAAIDDAKRAGYAVEPAADGSDGVTRLTINGDPVELHPIDDGARPSESSTHSSKPESDTKAPTSTAAKSLENADAKAKPQSQQAPTAVTDEMPRPEQLSPESWIQLQELIHEHGAQRGLHEWRNLQEGRTAEGVSITATIVPGSEFVGTGRATPNRAAVVAKAREEITGLGDVFSGQVKSIAQDGSAFRIILQDGSEARVTLMATELPYVQVARSQVNTERGDHTIQLSSRIADDQIPRALAHEIGEIVAETNNANLHGVPDRQDLLGARGARTSGALSPHDWGRVAEMNLLASKLEAPSISVAERAKVRRELSALVDDLGLRADAPGATERRMALTRENALSAQTSAALFDADIGLTKPVSTLDATDRAAVSDVRQNAAQRDQSAVDADNARRTPQLHPLAPDALNIEGRVSKPELRRIAKQAADRREQKSMHILEWLHQLHSARPPGTDFATVDAPVWIGGGAATAGLTPETLFIDAGGRWHDDASSHIAQTAQQLAALRDAGMGDPAQFAAPNERVPLEAIRAFEDNLAAQARVVNGTATLTVDSNGRSLLTISPEKGAPVTIVVGGNRPPVFATGFPRESVPGQRMPLHDAVRKVKAELEALGIDPRRTVGAHTGGSDEDAAQVGALLHDSAEATAIRDRGSPEAKRALDSLLGIENWESARAHDPKHQRVIRGDEASEVKDFGKSGVKEWVIAGRGGTAISAAENILKQTRGIRPPITVRMLGQSDPEGLRKNTQWQQIESEFGPRGENRFFVDDVADVGGLTVNANGEATGVSVRDRDDGPTRTVAGDGVVVAMGRNGLLPAPIADHVIDVYNEQHAATPVPGSRVDGQLLWAKNGQYLGYRIVVSQHGKTNTFDVTGAQSRFLPPELFPNKTVRELVSPERRSDTQANDTAEGRDASSTSGNFAGGFGPSATQARDYQTSTSDGGIRVMDAEGNYQ